MNRIKYLLILTIICGAMATIVSGCGSSDDLKPVKPDPNLANQEQRPGDKGMAGEEGGGGPKGGG